MSYGVARRTNEIGIRMALGAEQSRILRMVLREVLATAFAGVVAGLAITLGLTRFLTGLVYGLAPNDPSTFCLAAAILITIAACAGYQPARRAARIQPQAALHEE